MKKKHTAYKSDDLVYQTDRWSRYLWAGHLETFHDAQEIIECGQNKVFNFNGFAREVFHRLYADKPERLANIKPEANWAETLHHELDQLPAFKCLAERCRGEKLLAAISTANLCKHLIDDLPAAAEQPQDPEELRNQVRGLINFAQQLRADGNERAALQIEQDLARARQLGQAAVEKMLSYAQSYNLDQLRTVLRKALMVATDAAEDLSEQWLAYGALASDGIKCEGGSLRLKAELAKRVLGSRKLQRIAKEAGRLMRIAAEKQRSRADHARDEVADIELGNELGRLLPSELVKLLCCHLRLDFARRFYERALMQYRLKGKERQGKGPIIVCLDSSGSMRGEKEIWSKAMTLALLQIAIRQGRACRVIHFNGEVRRIDDWPCGKLEMGSLLDSMEAHFGGGTSFEPALVSALEAIKTSCTLKHADVVFLTDGEAQLSAGFIDEWNLNKLKYEFCVYAIHVDAPGEIAPPQLKAIADQVVALADIANDQAASNVVLSI